MALLAPKTSKKILLIPLSKIFPNPKQPRTIFDEAELQGLADSIRKNGILQPLLVRSLPTGIYELIAGERRLRAAKIAGLETVPCIELLVDSRRSALLALLENLQRQDLSFFEEAEGLAKLIDEWGITQQEASQRLGKSQSAIANKLRLLRLPPAQRHRIMAGRLTERHARALLRIVEDEERERVIDIIIAKELNVSETEEMIERMLLPKTESHRRRGGPVIRDLRLFVNTISRAVDTMRQSGVQAKTSKSETDDYIEYTIFIPKSPAALCGPPEFRW